jgi:glyoxylate reductase
LLIATFRRFTIAEHSLRKLKWKPNGIAANARDIKGKTLGILGLGSIGSRLAILAHALEMHVLYYSRHQNPNAPVYCKYFNNVEEMLRETDLLSIHVPLTSETVSLVGEKWIRMLKPGSVIINTARGKVVDEEAMIRALQDGHVSGIFSSVVLQPTNSKIAWWSGFGCLSR